MNDDQHLEALNEMRDLMKRSSRFLSLSGLSGVCAGIFALAGAGVAWYALRNFFFDMPFNIEDFLSKTGSQRSNNLVLTIEVLASLNLFRFLIIVACTVLALSLSSGWFFSWRKAKKSGVKFWDASAWRMLVNLMIPLIAGGVFCLIMLWHGIIGLVAPATLIFYGLGLLNASKYTLNDIRYLGLCEIFLGLVACFFVGYGLVFWTIGFGVLHIIYGAILYFKYERG